MRLEKERKANRRKEIIKIRAEINEIYIRKPIEKMNKTKSLFFGKKLINIKNLKLLK